MEQPTANLVITGQIGGRSPAARFLLELASASFDLGKKIFLTPKGEICGAYPKDPRPNLLRTMIRKLDPALSTWWISNTTPPPSEARKRYYLQPTKKIPCGINPIRFNPGVVPLPLALPLEKPKLLYCGALAGSNLANLIYSFTNLPSQSAYLLLNDYGYETESDPAIISSMNSPNILRLSGISNERQLAGVYAAASCLINLATTTPLQVYEAAACGIPVLSNVPLKINQEDLDPVYPLQGSFAEQLPEILQELNQNYSHWQQQAARICHLIQLSLTWHQVSLNFLDQLSAEVN